MNLWAAVTVGIVCLTVCVIAGLALALRYLQSAQEMSRRFLDAHDRTLASLERIHATDGTQLNGVLDRFMALDFSVFKSYQSAEQAEFGGFVGPDEEPDEPTGTITFNAGGRMVRPGADIEDQIRAHEEEQTLINEDFGPEFEAREGLR